VTQIGQAYASGTFRRVPMMIGATSGDMGERTGFMVGGARQISATLADKAIPTYYYRFSYVAESLNREAASHASEHSILHEHAGTEVRRQNHGTRQCRGEGHQPLRCEIRKADSKDPQIEGCSAISVTLAR
jgi:para-nitrobenzyl esterase